MYRMNGVTAVIPVPAEQGFVISFLSYEELGARGLQCFSPHTSQPSVSQA